MDLCLGGKPDILVPTVSLPDNISHRIGELMITPDWHPDRRVQQLENKEINQKRMWKLKQQPCTDCGLRWHPHCMTFDHIDRKGMKVSSKGKPVGINQVTYWNPKIFNMQLELMDVVCLNCHIIREAKRDMDDPKIKPNMKHLFPVWFEKCKGGLMIEETPRQTKKQVERK